MTPDQIATKGDVDALRLELREQRALTEKLLAMLEPRAGWQTIEEYAKETGKTKSTIRRWIKANRLETKFIGGVRSVRARPSEDA